MQDDLDAFLILTNRFQLECEVGKVLEIDPSSTDPYDLNTDEMIEEVKVENNETDVTSGVIDTDHGIDINDQESQSYDQPEELSSVSNTDTEMIDDPTQTDADGIDNNDQENQIYDQPEELSNVSNTDTEMKDDPTQTDAEVENDIMSPEQTNSNLETDVVRKTPGRKPRDASFIDANVMVKIKSHFEKIVKIKEDGGKRYFQCSKCNKMMRHDLRRHALTHVERHMENLIFSCKFCEKEFRLSDSLRMHMSRNHKKKML